MLVPLAVAQHRALCLRAFLHVQKRVGAMYASTCQNVEMGGRKLVKSKRRDYRDDLSKVATAPCPSEWSDCGLSLLLTDRDC